MPRTYADNSSNRILGRVGMTHGTAVVSRSSGGGGGGSSSSFGGGGSSGTYVDNASNRSLGRVGMNHGTAVLSRSSPDGGSSSRSYVDNSSNRSLGRVGLPVGSAVHSSSGSTSKNSTSLSYVDNQTNRSLGRVGLPVGSAVHSKSMSSTTSKSQAGAYVDTAYNRKLGRVGLTYGSSKESSTISRGTPTGLKTYVDNAVNRKLGRVGKALGSMPVSHQTSLRQFPPEDMVFRHLVDINAEDHNLEEVMRQIKELRNELRNQDVCDPDREMKTEAAEGIVNRHEAALTKHRAGLRAPEWIRGGEIIDFGSIALGEKLGSGGFGDVHVAIWKDDLQVAVKKLRVQRVSQQKKLQFQQEVKVFSSLSHPSIIRFYGACVDPPNLAIVMEFMAAGSLYDVLHVEMRRLDTEQKSRMVTDMLSALEYMHRQNIVHRDIKSMNIMVCEDYGGCKLGDFGLALKEEARSSASVADHGAVGTIKYSPPEVINGQRLSLDGLKSADVYSVVIVIVELLTAKEPYPNMNQHQVRAQILQNIFPSMQTLTEMNYLAKDLLKQGMSANPESRPSASRMATSWNALLLSHAIGNLSLTA